MMTSRAHTLLPPPPTEPTTGVHRRPRVDSHPTASPVGTRRYDSRPTLPIPAAPCARCGAQAPRHGSCISCTARPKFTPLPFGRVPSDESPTIPVPGKD